MKSGVMELGQPPVVASGTIGSPYFPLNLRT